VKRCDTKMKKSLFFALCASLVLVLFNNLLPPIYQPIVDGGSEIGRSDRGRQWIFVKALYQDGEGVWGVHGSGRVSLQMIDTAKRDSTTVALFALALLFGLLIWNRSRGDHVIQ
jgi:hypothetical protein